MHGLFSDLRLGFLRNRFFSRNRTLHQFTPQRLRLLVELTLFRKHLRRSKPVPYGHVPERAHDIGKIHLLGTPGIAPAADAWVYGAVDPGSGTAAMLESVHGIGALLKQGWRPKRTLVFASWDAEEEGLIGSTEWVEEHAQTLELAVAYFNTDVAVSGPEFTASAVPSLKQFVREIARARRGVQPRFRRAAEIQPPPIDPTVEA